MQPIGKILKSKRESLGMTLLDMEKRIKIERQHITKIENNDFNALPNPDYAVSFIKRYAESVNLNADHLLAEHHDELPRYKMTAKEARKSLQTHPVQEKHQLTPLLKLIGLTALVCTLLWLIAVYLFPHEREWQAASINPSRNLAGEAEPNQKKAVKDEKNQQVRSQQKKIKQPPETTIQYQSFDGTKLSYTVKTEEALQLRIQSKTPVRLQISTDQKQLSTYQKVTDRTVRMDKDISTLTLVVSNAAEMSVSLNDKKVDVPHDAENLITRTYQFNIMK